MKKKYIKRMFEGFSLSITFIVNLLIVAIFLKNEYIYDYFKNSYVLQLNHIVTFIIILLITSILINSIYRVVRYKYKRFYIFPSLIFISLILSIYDFLKYGYFSYSLEIIILILSVAFFINGFLIATYNEDFNIQNGIIKMLKLFFLILLFNGILSLALFKDILTFNFWFANLILIILLGIIIELNYYLKNNRLIFYLTNIILLNFYFVLSHKEYITNYSTYYLLISMILFFILAIVFYSNLKLNIKERNEYITKREKQIQLYIEQLDTVVDKKTKAIKDMNSQMSKELEYARVIQESLLPEKEIEFENVSFLSGFYPCEHLSGDFYEIFKIDKENIGMYILDVSGHGVSAAMLTMFCKNVIISDERLIRRYRGLKPHRNLKHLYKVFNESNFPPTTHMVMFFATYNFKSKTLKYSSGGTNCSPLVIKNNGYMFELDNNSGFPIAKLGEYIQPEYESSSILLEKGDRLLFFTDGLVDQKKNNIFSPEELKEFFKNNKYLALDEFDNQLNQKIQKHSNSLNDDVTYFLMEIN
ncbi:MAG: PP2C family protein-serine/threonine phosphatase [Bacillota bacterium]